METITKIFTAAKAKWDAIPATQKVTVLIAVLAVVGVTLWLA